MKSSSMPGSLHEVAHTERELTPNEAPPRPQLVRSPPERLSDISRSLTERRNSQPAEGGLRLNDDAARVKRAATSVEIGAQRSQSKNQTSGLDEERLAKLRDAMNAKILQQQRSRRSYGSPKADSGSPRVAAIQEEAGGINAVLARTMSNESTESSKTVRGSKSAKPSSDVPLRTPSYPFPYVPGTPKTWPEPLHQPFTALSPTAPESSLVHGHPQRASADFDSGASTPAATATAFMPPHAFNEEQEDPRFPTPNLYDMVLQLNAEPGLEQWWTTVTNLVHCHFRADRATLVVPRDPSDIENVPWGQKASFNMSGREDFLPPDVVLEQTLDAASRPKSASRAEFELRKLMLDDTKPQKLHAGRLRPRLEARHSYAGNGRDTKEVLHQGRPSGPQRTATHAAGMTSGTGDSKPLTKRLLSTTTSRSDSINDPEFSSVAEIVDAGPYAEVFSTLRDLDHESRPLIESGGISRVSERARVVTVTRDYLSENADGNTTGEFRPDGLASGESASDRTPRPSITSIFGNYRNVFASDNQPSALRDYEEYEQYPTSPWSQSPAPSPAVQADEEVNPFFASQEEQVEDSFNPTASPKDYSQLGQVEAIGVDRASTIIHIPLIHPTISRPMQSLKTYPGSTSGPDGMQRSATLDVERKAPIAILSILTSTVPYPRNLTRSLELFGPHLATSFVVSQQFSSMIPQAVTIRHRRTGTEQTISDNPMTIVPTSLKDIMTAEIQRPPGSGTDSVTSPSDYSRSPYSTSSSIVETPGWDPASHGWTASKSAAGTPALTGSEIVDSYFEAKKRSGKRTSSNASGQTHTTPARSTKKASGLERKRSGRTPSLPLDEASTAPQSDHKMRAETARKEEKAIGENQWGPDSPQIVSQHRHRVRHSMSHVTDVNAKQHHSQLHSYGADLQASFGGIPSTHSTEDSHSGVSSHGRKPSISEDMPPPSERLLRTIIDSVPVQIFTAEPGTGKLTWINSKFVVYRGQEARHVLDDPWQTIHPDDQDEFMTAWFRSLRTAQQLQQKVRLQRFDGGYRWFYVRAAPLRDKNQKIVHWIGTMMDFHDQNLAQENAAMQHETAASEAKYRALANSSPQIVFAANKTNGITFCNTQWVQFSGQSEGSARGVGFMDHVHPEDLAKCKLPTFGDGSSVPKNVPTSVPAELKRKTSDSATSSSGSPETERVVVSTDSSPLSPHMPQRKLSELADTGILKFSRDADGRPSYSTEVRLKSKDGDYRWHLVRVLLAEPLLQLDKNEETWYGTCTDISDHKALERDLKETMDEKSRFLSNMSHEIRTPLNGITGMVNFLIDSSLTAEQMEHVNIIRASTEGLRGLINDILDLSKAEAGMIHLNVDWLYVRSLIEEVNDLTSAMAIDKGLELNYIVDEDVPAQVKGDRFRIRQILLNIIGNAIKFTKKGEVFIHCSVHEIEDFELAMNELYIKFEVVDTGRGFTEEEAEHLFKRFSQIDGSSTRQHGGTGLGLVISRQLAQLHGGDMRATGIPGKGSTFTCLIKTTIPSKLDLPPTALPTPSGVNIPILAMPSTSLSAIANTPILTPPSESQPYPSPKSFLERTQSPPVYASSPEVARDSPAISSAGSDPSIASTRGTSAAQSHRSSASSFIPDASISGPPMTLSLPSGSKGSIGLPPESKLSTVSLADSPSLESATSSVSASDFSAPNVLHMSAGGSSMPPMYSILVLCPLKYSREATVKHIDKTLPENIPHQVTAKEHISECQDMLGGEDPVIFTHVVIVLQDVEEIITVIGQVLSSQHHQLTSIVVITDLAQKRRILEHAPQYDYDGLASERRLLFVFKPLKPSRFASIFDPRKEREMSVDRNRDSAQQVALTQKQVFEELTKRLGNKDKRVLLVEDNRTNQLVVLKFLAKVSIAAETAVDGVECLDKVFSKPFGHYSIILCDLHMPNKDGYQTCKEIRKWERDNKYPHLPIIALSANVLGDVHEKCVSSGFNSYLTKPVDFKELSTALMTFMDPSDPNKPHEFMKWKRRRSAAIGRQ